MGHVNARPLVAALGLSVVIVGHASSQEGPGDVEKRVAAYVPPNPADIDNAKKREKVALRPGQGGRARLEFTDYIKPGDRMAIDVDAAANALVGLSVNTYLDTPDDAVTLTVGFGALPDGASYNQQITLDAKAKNITVVVQNSGHRPVRQ